MIQSRWYFPVRAPSPTRGNVESHRILRGIPILATLTMCCNFCPSRICCFVLVLLSCIAGLRSSSARAQNAPPPPPSGDIRGTVKAGNIPLPGVTISATNTLTGKKVITSTDADGTYFLHAPGKGRYVIRAEFSAFAPATNEALITDSSPSATIDFALVLVSRALQAAQEQRKQAGAGNGAFQRMDVMSSEGAAAALAAVGAMGSEGESSSPMPGLGGDTATESISVSGNTAASPTGPMTSDAMRERIQEMRNQQGGAPGGGAASLYGGGLGGGGGGFGALAGARRRFDINRPHGSFYYTIGDSGLDAAPFSLNGQALEKPSFLQQSFGATLGGPLNIPRIYHGGNKTFFFVNYNGIHNSNPYDSLATVPTLEERAGNFSDTVIPSGPDAGQPVEIYNPKTGMPFPNNTIPTIDPVAQNLLAYIPQPNLPGDSQNFQYITTALNSSDALNLRIIHSFAGGGITPGRRGPQNNINIGFRFQDTHTDLTNPYPTVGGNTSVRSFDVPIGYVRTFHHITNNLRFEYNRNRVSTQNLYAFVTNVAGDAGVGGISQNPFDWGLPGLSFTNFGSVNDINPLLERDQTFTFSDSLIYTHGKHTWRWGGDFRRIHLNTETSNAARGNFTFTGYNTSEFVDGQPVAGTGFDFADFLLGLPQLTSVQFGNNSYYFRGNSWDLFVQDEWRIRGNLTFNLGLRYEYVSPYTEINNEIVNLDAAPGFTAVAPVLPGHYGPYTGFFPDTLVNPDRNNFAPRVGIAWKAFKDTVVRAGYGINYNTTAYSSIVQQLAFQPPFSVTSTNVESPSVPLTLENGFPPPPTNTITNSYGVDKNYRVGYVQIWNFDIQHQIRPTLVMNLDYTGTKGTRLDILDDPNRTPTGLLIANAQPFNYQTSNGNSILEAGSLKIRKRLQAGFSIGGTYTFSKSIDDASTIGGGAVVVAQNALDLAAERGLSSFDQRQRFTADYLWELPVGQDRHWLSQKGVARSILGDWNWSGDWTIASGLPFTVRVLGDSSEIVRGTNGTLRADTTGQPVNLPNPSVAEWFNTAAFVVPPSGQYGDAGRNTIIGPGEVVFDMAFTKIIPLDESRLLEIRTSATNVFNHPVFTTIDTTVNSPTFGRVIAAGAMRTIQLTGRFRF